jgi:hypothetical protein
MTVFEARAATILYNLLRTRRDRRPFLLPANVCSAVPLTFLRAGQPFHLVDIGADLGMDAERCLDLLERRPGTFGGLLYVRPYGAAARPEPLFRAAKRRQPDLLVIDDRCLCRPNCDGVTRASHADVTLYSTGRAKHTDLGFGGFAHLHPDVVYRHHRGGYRPEALTRLTRRFNAAAAAGRRVRGAGGPWLELAPPEMSWPRFRRRVAVTTRASDAQKRRLNAIYAAALPAEIQLPPRFQSWRFNVLVPEPDRLVARLFAANLFASRHYPSLAGVFALGPFPAAAGLHRWTVNLFNDRNFDEDMACRATEVVAAHLADAKPRQRARAALACRRVGEFAIESAVS